jgi:hypothetical protein
MATACQKEVCLSTGQLSGEWTWIKSVGFGTITPDTEMHTRHLMIDKTTYREFVNDSLVFRDEYELMDSEQEIFGSTQYLQFETGGRLYLILEGHNLQLIEWCVDCYSHFYTRN